MRIAARVANVTLDSVRGRPCPGILAKRRGMVGWDCSFQVEPGALAAVARSERDTAAAHWRVKVRQTGRISGAKAEEDEEED